MRTRFLNIACVTYVNVIKDFWVQTAFYLKGCFKIFDTSQVKRKFKSEDILVIFCKRLRLRKDCKIKGRTNDRETRRITGEGGHWRCNSWRNGVGEGNNFQISGEDEKISGSKREKEDNSEEVDEGEKGSTESGNPVCPTGTTGVYLSKFQCIDISFSSLNLSLKWWFH